MKTSCAVIAALLASAEAIKLDPFLGKIVGHTKEVYPFMFHENEDINSVPAPLNNKKYMTSTQAKLISKGQDDLAHEPWGLDGQFREPYNKYAPEPKLLQIEDSDSDSSSDSDSDSDDEDRMNVQWMVDADFGETDDQVVVREHDTGNGVKYSGWNNPLAWTDSGSDDDAILAQLNDEDDDESNVVTEDQQRTADQIATSGHATADTIDGDDKVL